MTDRIECLLCRRAFAFLPAHLRKSHGMTTAEYRAEFRIPVGRPLAGDGYRQMQREKFARLVAAGAIGWDHLPEAVEKARGVERTPRVDGLEQSERIRRTKPWEAKQLPPGAKRADGRDADRAREYQRQYRADRAKK